jgi:hypothetical protein
LAVYQESFATGKEMADMLDTLKKLKLYKAELIKWGNTALSPEEFSRLAKSFLTHMEQVEVAAEILKTGFYNARVADAYRPLEDPLATAMATARTRDCLDKMSRHVATMFKAMLALAEAYRDDFFTGNATFEGKTAQKVGTFFVEWLNELSSDRMPGVTATRRQAAASPSYRLLHKSLS